MGTELITLSQAKHWAGYKTSTPVLLIFLALNCLAAIATRNMHLTALPWTLAIAFGAITFVVSYILGMSNEKYQVEYINNIIKADEKILKKLYPDTADYAWHQERLDEAIRLLKSPLLLPGFRKMRRKALKDLRDAEPAEIFPYAGKDYYANRLIDEVKNLTEVGCAFVKAYLTKESFNRIDAKTP